MKRFSVCVDLGKKRDYFAMVVMEAFPKVVPGSPLLKNADRTVMYHHIVHIEQHKEMRYPDQVQKVLHIANYAKIKNDYDLLVDGTGIGEAVVDYLRDEHLYPLPIIFTSGSQVNEIYEDISNVFANTQDRLRAVRTLKEIRVPRDDLVASGQILMQQDRLRIAKGIPYREEFKEQLMGFTNSNLNHPERKAKYEAEDEDLHDDMVVCYLMGAWWALNSTNVSGFKERPLGASREKAGWNPEDYD